MHIFYLGMRQTEIWLRYNIKLCWDLFEHLNYSQFAFCWELRWWAMRDNHVSLSLRHNWDRASNDIKLRQIWEQQNTSHVSHSWDKKKRQLWENLENLHSAHCETYFSGETFQKNEKTPLVSISARSCLGSVNVT